MFQSKSTLYSCLNIKEVISRSRHQIWRSNDCNCTRTQKHLILNRTLDHFADLAKGLSCLLSFYLYGARGCMFLSCRVRVLEWIYTLQLPECQGTPFSRQGWNLKVKWLQVYSNPEPLNSKAKIQSFCRMGQMIELCSEYLSVRWIWLYALAILCTRFRENPHSIRTKSFWVWV